MKLITVPNIVLFVGIALNVGGWIRNTTYLEERLKALEARVAAERVTSDLVYMRRDVLTEQLGGIREEQKQQRELIQALRRDLR